MRRALAAYLVLIVTAGPSLCCCELPRMLRVAAASKTAPADDLPPCCAAERLAQTPIAPTPTPLHDCPCKQHAKQTVAMIAPALDVAAVALPVGCLPVLSLSLCLSQTRPKPTPHLPFLSTAERLYVHHVLRC